MSVKGSLLTEQLNRYAVREKEIADAGVVALALARHLLRPHRVALRPRAFGERRHRSPS